MSGHRRTALITGASAGIGATFARFLAAQGYDLVLVARRVERLNELAKELNQQFGIKSYVFAADLTDKQAPTAIMAFVKEQSVVIDMLINNAGLSGKTAFADTPWQDLANEIQLMITAVTELAYRVIPYMKQQGWGRIIN
ncbi:MAG TPA: SDR family NAD(P)-dependent oxidoreductase [Agitococcus sp.]|nr:SDR family NAD(P)-dependent oxidoreductase [Agitococcus sp.]